MKNIKKKKPHYVSNKDFTKAVVDYAMEVEEAKKHHREPPRVPEYIGECFLKMAEGIAHRPNFYSYSYREELVSDAVENCLRAIGNFKVGAATRSGNPNAFGYFTQIIWFAFLRRIAKEKKQNSIKEEFIECSSIDQFMTEGDGSHINNSTTLERMKSRVWYND